MAKPQKKQNKSIEKRKQQKKKKRELTLKKKASAGNPSKISLSRAKDYIMRLPHLIFEDEIEKIRLPMDYLEEVKDMSIEKALSKLDINQFLESCVLPLEELLMRVHERIDPQINFCARALVTMIQKSQDHETIFPFVIAKFLKDKRDAFTPEDPLTPANVMEAIEEAIQNFSPPEQPDDEEPDTENESEDAEFAKINREFSEYLGEGEFAGNYLDACETEIYVFTNDYLHETKGFTELDQCKPSHISGYLTGWYLRNAKPSKEEMSEMLSIFGTFLDFLSDKQLRTEEWISEAQSKLSDREYFLDMVE